MKVADNKWTATKLLERLRNQLCGDYLRDIRSNCGIFLLIYRGQKKFWKHPKTNKKLNFIELVHFLRKEAYKIVTINNKIEAIEIISIDVSKRTELPDIRL